MMELLVLEMASGILARENATLSRPTLRRVNNKLWLKDCRFPHHRTEVRSHLHKILRRETKSGNEQFSGNFSLSQKEIIYELNHPSLVGNWYFTRHSFQSFITFSVLCSCCFSSLSYQRSEQLFLGKIVETSNWIFNHKMQNIEPSLSSSADFLTKYLKVLKLNFMTLWTLGLLYPVFIKHGIT